MPVLLKARPQILQAPKFGRSQTQEYCALTGFFSGSIFSVLMLVLQLGHVLIVNDGAAFRSADE